MDTIYTMKLEEMVNNFQLEKVCIPDDYDKIKITTTEVDRPGLALAGFFELFDPRRIQIIGKAEHTFLGSMTSEERRSVVDNLLSHRPVAVVTSRNLTIYEEMSELARIHQVPLLRTDEITSAFMAALIALLNLNLAPRITRHGVLVEVYGQGILILGDSGIGKSETAIELVKRGHRLIADDAVEIKRVSTKTLVGTAPEIIRYYVELRGIGIVDVRRLFGMGSVKETEKIELIIILEPWVQGKMYDRMGLDNETTEILGIKVPTTTIPVKPGRNLAIILEIAAMNNRQKRMGYNTPVEFNKRLMSQMELGNEQEQD